MPNRCVAAACGNMPSDSVSLFRFPSLKASLGFAVQRKRVLKSTAVPSIFKRNEHVPEKKARKSTAVEKLAAKRVSFCPPVTATD